MPASSLQNRPRLNAAGRMGDAKRAVELFISNDSGTVESIAELLDDENRETARTWRRKSLKRHRQS